MRIETYLDNLPKGEVVTNKSLLSVLKRKGLIYDYSYWGYLESQWVYYRDGDEISSDFSYTGKEINDGDKGSYSNPYDSLEDFTKSQHSLFYIEYKGIRFATKYLDGCFNAYLYRYSNNPKLEDVNRRMSVFGKIV